jgi:hypothetical protein
MVLEINLRIGPFRYWDLNPTIQDLIDQCVNVSVSSADMNGGG